MVSLCGGFPVLGANDGQTDLALLIYVGVVYSGLEGDLGRLERVLGGEVDLDLEGSSVVGRIVLGSDGNSNSLGSKIEMVTLRLYTFTIATL